METCDIAAQTGCTKTCQKENIKDKNEQAGKCLFPNENKQTNKITRGPDCKSKISAVDKIA